MYISFSFNCEIVFFSLSFWYNYLLKNTSELGYCEMVSEENIGRQHQMVLCRMKFDIKVKKRMKAETRIKWWKLNVVQRSGKS